MADHDNYKNCNFKKFFGRVYETTKYHLDDEFPTDVVFNAFYTDKFTYKVQQIIIEACDHLYKNQNTKIYKTEQQVLDRFELPIVRGAINRSIKYMLLEDDHDPRLEKAVSLSDKIPPYLQNNEEEEEGEEEAGEEEEEEEAGEEEGEEIVRSFYDAYDKAKDEDDDSNENKIIKYIPAHHIGTLTLASEMYMPLEKRQTRISGQLTQYVGSDERKHILNNAWVGSYIGKAQTSSMAIFTVRGTDSLYQLISDFEMIVLRSPAYTRFYASVKNAFMEFVKDVSENNKVYRMQIVYLTGHSLAGSVILELMKEFGMNSFSFEIRAIAYNPYLPKGFIQTPHTTIYSTKGDWCSNHDKSILKANPKIMILDGQAVEEYKLAFYDKINSFSLGKHSIKLMIEQTRRIIPDVIANAMPGFDKFLDPLHKMGRMLGVKIKPNDTFEKRVRDEEKRNKETIKDLRDFTEKLHLQSPDLLSQLYSESNLKNVHSYTAEQQHNRLFAQLYKYKFSTKIKTAFQTYNKIRNTEDA